MSIEIFMRLDPGGAALVPADEQDAQALAELLEVGGMFKVKVTQPRTNGFHRKGMALFRFLFNLWEPVSDRTPNGVPVSKDFDSFRENVTIAAGYYRQVFDLSGGFELKAVSLKWDTMDNVKFAKVYSRVIDVGLEMIGKADFLTHEQVERNVDRLLGFA